MQTNNNRLLSTIVFWTVFLTVELVFVRAQDQQHIPLLYSDVETPFKMDEPDPNNRIRYFSYAIDQKTHENSTLTIIVTPLDFKSDPDIFFSDRQPFPNKFNAEVGCWYYGMDACFVPRRYTNPGSTLYIGVSSELEHCHFSIKIKYTASGKNIEFGKEEYLHFESSDENIANSTDPTTGVPDDKQNLDEQFFSLFVKNTPNLQHFTVSAIVDQNSRGKIFQHIKMYVGLGKEPPTTGTSLYGVYSTNYGVIFTAFNGDFNFRTGVDYTFVIVAPHGVIISILARKDDQGPILIDFLPTVNRQQRTLYDAIPIRKQLTYYFLTSSLPRDENKAINSSLIINLLVSQGDPNLYVACDTLPQNFIDYPWKSEGLGLETLIISREEFSKQNQSCDKIFITVYARICAAFALEIFAKNSELNGGGRASQTVMKIVPGIVENGFIKTDEIITYMLTLPNTAEEQVTTTLVSMHGNPDLYIKRCTTQPPAACNVTLEEIEGTIKEIQQSASSVPVNHDFVSFTDKLGNNQISFNHQQNACDSARTGSIMCMYLISVLANKKYNIQDQELQYSLRLALRREAPLLQEGIPYRDTVQVDQYNYYKFNLITFNSISDIYFQLTPFTGDPALMLSRSMQNPTIDVYEKRACLCISLIHYDKNEINQKDQYGNAISSVFYIAVYGISQSEYTINVIIERDGPQQVVPKVIKLLPDTPQKAVFIKESEKKMFFEIKILKTQIDRSVEVQLAPIKGQFVLAASPVFDSNSTNFPQDIKEFKYISINKHLFMQMEDDISASFTTSLGAFVAYRVAVFKLSEVEQSQFTISYSTNDKIKELIPGQSQQIVITYEKSLWFRFKVTPEDKYIQIVHTAAEKGIVMHISGEVEDFDSLFSEKSTEGLVENQIFIDKPYERECSSQFKECYLYGVLRFNEEVKSIIKFEDDSTETRAKQGNFSKEDNSSKQQSRSISSLLMVMKCDKNNSASLISLHDGDTAIVPFPPLSDNIYKFRFITRPSNLNKILYTDVSSENVNIIIKKDILDGKKCLNNGNNISFPSLNQKEQNMLINLQDNKHYHINTLVMNSQTINPKELEACQSDCIIVFSVFVYNPHKLDNQFTIQHSSAGDILDITHQENKPIFGWVNYQAYKYYRIHLRDQEQIVYFRLQVLNNGDASLTTSFNENSEYRPMLDFTYQTLCPSCKYSRRPGKLLDSVEYSPAYPGTYIIGIKGEKGLNISYSLQYSVNGVPTIKEGVPEKVMLIDQGTYFLSLHSDSLGDYSEVEMHFLTKQYLVNSLLVFIKLCKSTIISKCQVPTQANYDIFFMPSILPHESNNKLLNLSNICPGGLSLCNFMILFKSITGELEFSFIVSNRATFFVEEELNQTGNSSNSTLQKKSKVLVIKPGLVLTDNIKPNQLSFYKVFFSQTDINSTQDYIIVVNTYVGEVAVDILPAQFKKHTVNQRKGKVWIRIPAQSFHANVAKNTTNSSNQEEVEDIGSSLLGNLEMFIQISACKDAKSSCIFDITCLKRGDAVDLKPGSIFADYIAPGQKQKFLAMLNQYGNKIDSKNISSTPYASITTFSDSNFIMGKRVMLQVYNLQYDQVSQNEIRVVTYQKNFTLLQSSNSFVVPLAQGQNEIALELENLSQSEQQQMNNTSTSIDMEYALSVQSGQFTSLSFINEEIEGINKGFIYGQKFLGEDPDIYQLILPTQQKVGSDEETSIIVELKNCKGKFTVSAASAYQLIQNKNYDIQVKDSDKNSIFMIANIKPQLGNGSQDLNYFYISVELQNLPNQGNSSTDNEGFYSLGIYNFGKKISNYYDLPIFQVLPGNNGLVEHTLTMGDSGEKVLNLNWVDIEEVNQHFISKNDFHIQHTIRVSKSNTEDDSRNQQMCAGQPSGLKTGQNETYSEGESGNQSQAGSQNRYHQYMQFIVNNNDKNVYDSADDFSLDGTTLKNRRHLHFSVALDEFLTQRDLLEGQTIYVSLTATLNPKNKSHYPWPFNVYYKVTPINLQILMNPSKNHNQHDQFLWFIFLTIVALSLIVAVAIYFKKSKKIEVQIAYEMTQGREDVSEIVEKSKGDNNMKISITENNQIIKSSVEYKKQQNEEGDL